MTTDDFMREVWRGPDEEVARCRECLMALGEDGEADCLRDLLARIILMYRRQQGPAWPAWPAIVNAEGDSINQEQIAGAVNWPRDRIDADLDKLVEVGLLRYKDA